MNVINVLKADSNGDELLITAKLAVAFTLLSMAPYDSWRHEGTPAEMAAYIVAQSKKDGRLGLLVQALAPEYYKQIGP